MRRTVIAAAAFGALAALSAWAGPEARAETPIPAAPTRFVTDRAGLLSARAVGELDARLAAYERGTGHQILVYVDRTTGGAPVEDWAVRAFEAWKVGRKGIDDGAALFVFTQDRRLRIEVGYGLEGLVPDVVAKRIIEERIAPRLRAGDGDGAVRAGVDGLVAAVGGQGAPAAPDGLVREPVPIWLFLVGALAVVVIFGFAARHPAFATWLLYVIASSRGGGWRGGGGGGWSGGGGGGGFSGGGGRSGGGGASGSW